MSTGEAIEAPKRRRKRAKKPAETQPKPPKRTAKKVKGKGEVETLDLLVDFLGVSIGDSTARVGLKVSRNQLTLSKADRALCGRRLTGRIVLTPNGEDPDQQVLFDGAKLELSATFDVKRFGVAPDWLSCGLTFPLREIDCSELAHFAKKQGRLQVDEIGDIPSKRDEKDEE